MNAGQIRTDVEIRREAASLAARLPSLVVAARQVAQTVRHGVHGRRRAGSGETFWQFRPFLSGEPAARVDWRRSAREERAFVREREWEAAHTIWIWFDRSASMRFRSDLAKAAKIDRAAVLALAFADLCVDGGERAGLIGLTRPIAGHGIIERLAEAIGADERLHGTAVSGLPSASPIPRRAMALLIGDFLGDLGEIERTLRAVAGEGALGEIVMIADPIEETYPFEGHVEFLDALGVARLRAPRAQDLREAYLRRLAAHREAVRSIASRQGWGVALHRTDQSAAQALLALRSRLGVQGLGQETSVGAPAVAAGGS